MLDAGAVRAVVERRASLLAAGITGGRRAPSYAGDPVDLAAPDGTPVARGLVNFDAEELPAAARPLLERPQARARRGYEREVVHRDDLVLL